VANTPEHRLYYYPKPGKHGAVVITYPVSIGSLDWQTPQGRTRIVQKISNPAWHPPQSIREEHKKNGDPLPAVVPPGPQNPLGKFALRLDLPGGDYMIHGTNNPLAVGLPVTHGCVRLYPSDIESLFAKVPVGTPVTLVTIPVKLAAADGELLVQAAPPAEGAQPAGAAQALMDRLSRTAAAPGMDWARVQKALTEANGVLAHIGRVPDAEPLAQAMYVSLRSRPGPGPRAGHALRRGLAARNSPS